MTDESKIKLILELLPAYFEGEYDANCAVMALDSIFTIVDFEEDEEDA